MKKVKLIIELDEDKYIKLKKYVEQSGCSDYFDNAIAKATPLQEELEKIKAEIIGNDSDLIPPAYEQAIKDHLKIIDNHIYELKGENK